MEAAAALLRPYVAFSRTAFLNLLAYRARYVVGILTYFFNVSVWYFVWRALFAQAPAGGTIGGFTFPQMLTYVATGWVLRSFYFNEVDRDIASQVQEGRLAMALVKPVDFQAMTMAQTLGESAFRGLLFAIPIGIVVVAVYPVLPPASFLAGPSSRSRDASRPSSSERSTSASGSSP
jgi:ABC-2 type transport system permease protein